MKGKAFEVGLVVVLCILVLLVFLPPFGAPSAERGRQLRSETQARFLVQAAIVFADDNEGRFPTAEEWPDALIELGIIDRELLISAVEDGDGVSFIHLPIPGKWPGGNFDNRIVIYEDPKHFEKGVVVGFADARTEFIKHEDFKLMLSEQLATDNENRGDELP